MNRRERIDIGLVIAYTVIVVGIVVVMTACAIIDGSAYRVKPAPRLRPCNPTWTLDSLEVCADTSSLTKTREAR